MRAWLVVLALCGVAEAAPMMRPPPPPPILTHCREAATWDDAQRCIDTWERGAVTARWSPQVAEVTSGGRHYVFAELAGRWRLVYEPGDGGYELVGINPVTLGKQTSTRIDLSHHVPIGNTSVFIERVTLVCSGAADCTALVTACTVLARGRAIETFRGDLTPTANGLVVSGDRRYVGDMCKNR